jgi:FKBP-type peptidyl-prolyl cis-trans isomerase FkpA
MKKSLTVGLLILLALGWLAPSAVAQQKAKTKETSGGSSGYKNLSDGLQYKIIKSNPENRKAEIGDFITMNIRIHIKDSVIFDSKKMYNDKPVPYQLHKPNGKGDITEGLLKMHEGDEVRMRFPVDSIVKFGGKDKLPPYAKPGEMEEFEITMVSVKSEAEFKAAANARANEQVQQDDKTLEDYFAKNNIKATKTASGLYYVISQEGSGDFPKPGQKVTVNYTGKTLDGKEFDSNVDPAKGHVQPFPFTLGQHQVIQGWDEGIQLIKKGGKGTLYIPSPLAYGEHSPSPDIPANGILVFDVEVTDVQ